MTSNYDDRDRAALDQLEDLLDAYADARLMPVGPVLARMRTAVLAEAAAAAADRRRAEIRPAPKPRFILPQLHLARRAIALGAAAALTLGTSAAVMAAPPGSPFYNARLVIETALLPTQIDARLAAYEEHLDDRLREAEAAAASGNADALAAALAAYQAEVDASLGAVGDDDGRLAKLQAALEKHLAKLQELAVRLPTEVARNNAVEHAIDASEKAVEKLKVKSKKNNTGPATEPGQGGGRPDEPNPNQPDPDKPNPPGRP